MEQRRFIVFVILSTLILIGWMQFAPVLFPGAFQKQPAGKNGGAVAQADKDAAAEEVAGQPDSGEPRAEDAAPAPQQRLAEFPDRTVVLGSMDVDSGYFQEVKLTSRGAAIESATLNDPRFITADGRREQLKVIGNNPDTEKGTLQSSIAAIDKLLAPHGTSLRDVNWEVIPGEADADGTVSKATFRYPSPDGALEVLKTFRLNKGDAGNRDGDHLGYLLDVTLEVRNLTAEPRTVDYVWQGPVGLPLENVENTNTFRQIKVGTVDDPRDPVLVTAKQVVEDAAAGANVQPWRDPLQYIGVDVQYFGAFLFPVGDQRADRNGDGKPDPYFAESRADLVDEDQGHPQRSDISVVMRSGELSVAPGASEKHEFRLYIGPKRSELLEPLNADGVVDFGFFGRISVWMLHLLNFFHYVLRLPYGLAIILLTLIVRACMFPITRKQAAGAKKMKELQPELQALKTKYAKEPEKFWMAQRELFRKHNYHPLSGCLPLFLQLPIFIGLYNALNNSVDLRMTGFLWIDNLAAPDALFQLPFRIPFLGSDFNLLPIITIALWLVQQQLFMPPAATEEQALQYKMMNYMMVFFGFMMYHVPAGLCVYFITSTLWGITERKVLDWKKDAPEKAADAALVEAKPRTPAADAPRKPSWLERLVAAADEAKNPTNGRSKTPASGSAADGGRPSKKPRRSKPRR
jgi:YidC/Oxa1 family membrane protein insertase